MMKNIGYCLTIPDMKAAVKEYLKQAGTYNGQYCHLRGETKTAFEHKIFQWPMREFLESHPELPTCNSALTLDAIQQACRERDLYSYRMKEGHCEVNVEMFACQMFIVYRMGKIYINIFDDEVYCHLSFANTTLHLPPNVQVDALLDLFDQFITVVLPRFKVEWDLLEKQIAIENRLRCLRRAARKALKKASATEQKR